MSSLRSQCICLTIQSSIASSIINCNICFDIQRTCLLHQNNLKYKYNKKIKAVSYNLGSRPSDEISSLQKPMQLHRVRNREIKNINSRYTISLSRATGENGSTYKAATNNYAENVGGEKQLGSR